MSDLGPRTRGVEAEECSVAKDIVGRPVITAVELCARSPGQREAVFVASVVTDLDDLPATYVARLRTGAADPDR